MRFLRNSLIALGLLAALIGFTLEDGDPALYPPAADAPVFEIHVADHGWHTGLVLKTSDILAVALQMPDDLTEEASTLLTLARIMGEGDWVEIGWGDEAFYQADVAGPLDMPILTGLRSLLLPTSTVLHVYPGLGAPKTAFPESAVLSLTLSEEGFSRLAIAVARDFAARGGVLRDLGPGLYGYARFYAAQGAYTLFRTCNNWAAARLAVAGVPASWATSAFSLGLRWELSLRAQ
ncbi:MAG: DUF2459 domain-containing protein [Pseudomonadota bacterium]